jgi:hypothetical protein
MHSNKVSGDTITGRTQNVDHSRGWKAERAN